jgi:hypothetical protein
MVQLLRELGVVEVTQGQVKLAAGEPQIAAVVTIGIGVARQPQPRIRDDLGALTAEPQLRDEEAVEVARWRVRDGKFARAFERGQQGDAEQPRLVLEDRLQLGDRRSLNDAASHETDGSGLFRDEEIAVR